MSDQADSSRRSPPMTSPPSPTIPDDSSHAILGATSEEDSSSTVDTDLLSLWLSNYTGLPQFEAKEEPVEDVPTLLNFELDSSILDVVDWNTTNTAFPQEPVVTQSLWVQLQSPVASEVDDLSRLALGIQSPKTSLALRIQDPEAPISPLVIGTESSILPMAHGIEFPEASISPLAPGTQPPLISSMIHSVPSSFSSLPTIPYTLLTPPPLWNLIPTNFCTEPVAPPLWNLVPIACSVPILAPPLWNLPSIPCTMPMAPPFCNFLLTPSPVPERRSWSEFQSTIPPTRGQFLLPDPASASESVSSLFSLFSHPPHHLFPAANTRDQQQVSDAHAPVTSFPTGNANANANYSAGSGPVSRTSWSQAMATTRGIWTPNQPWISSASGQAMTPRRPRFLLPPTTATMPATLSLPIANVGSSTGNMPSGSGSARRDVPVGDHQRVQTGESSRPRKRAKPLVLDISGSEASQWSLDGAKVAPITREEFAPEPALNRNGKKRALPGTATDLQSLYARYEREKVKQRVKVLQSLVPYGDQVDMVILLEQVHIYIKFLEQKIKVLKSSMNWKLADLPHPQ